MIEGTFTHPGFLDLRFQAERQEDGSIWSVEVLGADGGCFDTVDFPEDRAVNERAFTDEGARAVIVELLTEHYAIGSP